MSFDQIVYFSHWLVNGNDLWRVGGDGAGSGCGCRQPPNASLTRMEADLSRHNATWLDRIPINLQMMVLMCRRLRLFDTAVGFFFFPCDKNVSVYLAIISQRGSAKLWQRKKNKTLPNSRLWALTPFDLSQVWSVWHLCVCVCWEGGGRSRLCYLKHPLKQTEEEEDAVHVNHDLLHFQNKSAISKIPTEYTGDLQAFQLNRVKPKSAGQFDQVRSFCRRLIHNVKPDWLSFL